MLKESKPNRTLDVLAMILNSYEYSIRRKYCYFILERKRGHLHKINCYINNAKPNNWPQILSLWFSIYTRRRSLYIPHSRSKKKLTVYENVIKHEINDTKIIVVREFKETQESSGVELEIQHNNTEGTVFFFTEWSNLFIGNSSNNFALPLDSYMFFK